MSSYYNENDPKAAEILRELIKGGHIADGEVDERSIEDIAPVDLWGFTQCHFFAGIGTWSYALRQAGWPDDNWASSRRGDAHPARERGLTVRDCPPSLAVLREPSFQIWTMSCPCQPFSSAGKGAGFADERHLWPAAHHLIKECRPVVVFGEQVAGKDGITWLDLVQSDLEGEGYTSGAAITGACCFGAPHQRKRLYWVAEDTTGSVADTEHAKRRAVGQHREDGRYREDCGRTQAHSMPGTCGEVCSVADSERTWVSGGDKRGSGACGGEVEEQEDRPHPANELSDGVQDAGSVADADSRGCPPVVHTRCGSEEARGRQGDSVESSPGKSGSVAGRERPGPTNGHWRDADWLFCRDGKWRPVIPTLEQMVDGTASDLVRVCNQSGGYFSPLEEKAPARVMRLKGYGNGLVAQQAQAFIESYIEHEMDASW